MPSSHCASGRRKVMDPGFGRADVPRRDGGKGSERAIGRRARAYLRGVGLLDGRLPLLHDGILRDGRDTVGMRPVRRAREPRPRGIALVVATAGGRGRVSRRRDASGRKIPTHHLRHGVVVVARRAAREETRRTVGRRASGSARAVVTSTRASVRPSGAERWGEKNARDSARRRVMNFYHNRY